MQLTGGTTAASTFGVSSTTGAGASAAAASTTLDCSTGAAAASGADILRNTQVRCWEDIR